MTAVNTSARVHIRDYLRGSTAAEGARLLTLVSPHRGDLAVLIKGDDVDHLEDLGLLVVQLDQDLARGAAGRAGYMY